MSQPFPFSGQMIARRFVFRAARTYVNRSDLLRCISIRFSTRIVDKHVQDACMIASCLALTGFDHEWAVLRAIKCSGMGVTIELQNLGDAQLCRDITAHIEHAFADRRGDWRVSIAGSRASQNWEMRVEAILGKKHDNQKPERSCAQDGNIVRVDVNRVTPDLIRGKGDGIRRDDEIAVASVDDGRVLANLRSNEQARIMLRPMPQQRPQMLKRKLADWQRLRLAASHALTIIDDRAWQVKDEINSRRFTISSG
jgi:hypothetical protein